jgi:DNA-binding response OmpR family regulator
MARATFILVEPEPDQALSSRKLVLETAKFNVITAYTAQEGLEMLALFPKADAVIVHSQIKDIPCEELFGRSKRDNSKRTTIYLNAAAHQFSCHGADHTVSSHDPEALMHLLREMFGDPRQVPRFGT